MIGTASNILTALISNGQIPLDGKTFFLTLTDIKNLGAGNNNAFKYYEGMLAYVNENKTRYQWREVKIDDGPGLLATHFTYPAGSQAIGIDYSGRTFNFFQEDKLTTQDIVNMIESADLSEIKFLASEQEYIDLINADEDDPKILYLTPEAIQPEWLAI